MWGHPGFQYYFYHASVPVIKLLSLQAPLLVELQLFLSCRGGQVVVGLEGTFGHGGVGGSEHSLRHSPARVQGSHFDFLLEQIGLHLHEFGVLRHPSIHDNLLHLLELRAFDVVIEPEGDRVEDRLEHVRICGVVAHADHSPVDVVFPEWREDGAERWEKVETLLGFRQIVQVIVILKQAHPVGPVESATPTLYRHLISVAELIQVVFVQNGRHEGGVESWLVAHFPQQEASCPVSDLHLVCPQIVGVRRGLLVSQDA